MRMKNPRKSEVIKRKYAQGRDGRWRTEAPEVVGERSRASRSASSAKERNEKLHNLPESAGDVAYGVTVKSDVAGKRTLRKSKRSKKQNASPRKSQNGATAERRLTKAKRAKESRRRSVAVIPIHTTAGETRRQTASNSPFARETPRLTRGKEVAKKIC